jgi:hypothetical protein
MNTKALHARSNGARRERLPRITLRGWTWIVALVATGGFWWGVLQLLTG